jgi:ATP-dependent DNA helicase RecQ
MAENRPESIDDMAHIHGVGAKKLDSYGQTFLAVINGGAADLHPARMRLAGRSEGALFDRLQDAQTALARGADGTGKPLSCNATTLRKIAEGRPRSMAELQGMGEQKAERFGAEFLRLVADG